jgi:hypothetical protein
MNNVDNEVFTSRLQLLRTNFPWVSHTENWLTESESESESESASLSWNKASILGLRPYFCYCQTVAGLSMWSGLSDEKTDLSFTIAAGPCQRSDFRVRVLWDSRLWVCCSYELCKWSVNQITNPDSVSSQSYIWQYHLRVVVLLPYCQLERMVWVYGICL